MRFFQRLTIRLWPVRKSGPDMANPSQPDNTSNSTSAPISGQGRLRLDQLLVEREFFSTRSRARDAIVRGTVSCDNQILSKPGLMVDRDIVLALDDPAQRYVSRAALKLIAALDGFNVDVQALDALDIGASTGGFTQVLLERGAAHVTAIDVGHGQLHQSLFDNSRITLYEGLNARALEARDLQDHLPDIIVSDVSFISLKLALPPALTLAKPEATALLLVKPQFEVGREAIGKGGVVKDKMIGEKIADELYQWLDREPGWQAKGLLPSPIEGGDGNREFLLYGMKNR